MTLRWRNCFSIPLKRMTLSRNPKMVISLKGKTVRNTTNRFASNTTNLMIRKNAVYYSYEECEEYTYLNQYNPTTAQQTTTDIISTTGNINDIISDPLFLVLGFLALIGGFLSIALLVKIGKRRENWESRLSLVIYTIVFAYVFVLIVYSFILIVILLII